MELLKESPSPSLRSCWALAQAYNTLARELFNAAFVSCWMELRPVHQEDLVTNLRQALTHQTIPEITQTILNLAEFMEHCEEATVSGLCTTYTTPTVVYMLLIPPPIVVYMLLIPPPLWFICSLYHRYCGLYAPYTTPYCGLYAPYTTATVVYMLLIPPILWFLIPPILSLYAP